MVEIGSEFFLVVVSQKETNKHIGWLCKGFMIKTKYSTKNYVSNIIQPF
jgi:hypothetical protein